jgi:hypothetical protein
VCFSRQAAILSHFCLGLIQSKRLRCQLYSYAPILPEQKYLAIAALGLEFVIEHLCHFRDHPIIKAAPLVPRYYGQQGGPEFVCRV